MKLPITNEARELADSYAKKFISANKSLKNFGNRSVMRSSNKQYSDACAGRIGELMFSEMLGKYGYSLIFDEEIREGGNSGDGCKDIEGFEFYGAKFYLKKKIDIKSTVGNWLLVEDHRFEADAYVLLKVTDTDVTYRGYCFEKDFFNNPEEPKYEYRSGDRLRNAFDTSKLLSVRLDAPLQYGLPFSELRVGGFIDYLKSNAEPI